MALTGYKREKFLPPLDIIAGENDQFDVDENGGAISTTVTVPPGTYYAHRDVSLDPTYPSVFLAIENALNTNATLTGTYTISVGTPDLSTEQTDRGLTVTATGVTDFEFARDATTERISISRILGMADQAVGYPSVGTTWTSPYTYQGAWVNMVERQSDYAPPQRVIFYSTEYTERDDAYAVDYGRRGPRGLRNYKYFFLPAANVWRYRADRLRYANAGQLAQYDTNNSFEDMWYQMSDLRDVLVVYYEETDALDLDVSGLAYEVVRGQIEGEAQDFSDVASEQLRGAEHFRLDFSMIVKESTYLY